MMESAVVSYLANAAWMAAAVALSCAAVERAGIDPRTRELAWIAGLLLAVLTPMGGWLPDRLAAIPDFRFTASIAPPATSGGLRWPLLIAGVYAFFVAVSAARLVWRWARLSRFSESTIAAPMTFGIWRPRVLLPERFRREAPPLAVETALAHERTHLERGDFLHNLIVEFAVLPVAFHPAVWFMRARLAQARELVCDDLTARAFGDRRRYALGLIEAARALAQSSATGSRLAMGMLDHRDFEERIMLLNHPAPARFRRGSLLLGALLAFAPAMTLFGFYFQNDETVYKIGNGVAAPKVVYKEEPPYSDAAETAQVQGTVVLTLEISRAGLAEKIAVKRGLHAELDANAVECLKRWRFDPATKDGAPVRVAATIEVNFRLK